MFLKTLKEYMASSSFHGLRFIGQDGVHWTERVFWVVTILLSWYFSSTLIVSSWSGYQNNAISFVADTTYKEWNTPFPSVTICEVKNVVRTKAATKRYWNSTPQENSTHDINLEEVLKVLAYFGGNSYYIKEYCYVFSDNKHHYDEAMKCPRTDFRKVTMGMRGTCDEVFERCYWRDKEFDCCTYFLPLDTEFGLCYSINNVHVNASYHPERHILDTMSNFSTGPGKISITLRQNNYMGYFHAREDVPSLNTPKSQRELLTPKYPIHLWFSVLEVQNDPEVKDTSVEQRKCRFIDENFLTSFDKYGYEPCLVECRKQHQLKLCGCNAHVMPRSQQVKLCDLDGLICVGDYHVHMSVLKNEWNHNDAKKGIKCSQCIATCTEIEMHITRKLRIELNESAQTNRFEIAMEALPTERPRRIVVRGILDLVVSMGGAAGLLVGASLLSFVEFIYFFTLRLYGNYKTNTDATSLQNK